MWSQITSNHFFFFITLFIISLFGLSVTSFKVLFCTFVLYNLPTIPSGNNSFTGMLYCRVGAAPQCDSIEFTSKLLAHSVL